MTHSPNKRLQKASKDMSKLILGVGTNSRGKYKATIDGKNVKAYRTWYNMLHRAYCPKRHAKQPTYADCSVADEWLEYQDFADWFENHEYSNRGYQLDKDLLIPGNKIYTPDRRTFVPRQLNTLLNDCGAARGQYPQGAILNKRNNKFMARIRINGKDKYLGNFDTEQEAYQAYKEAKEANVKRMANHWQDDIAANVYDSLLKWRVGND